MSPGVAAGWRLLPPRPGTPPLAEALTADVTVIGAGFAGLSRRPPSFPNSTRRSASSCSKPASSATARRGGTRASSSTCRTSRSEDYGGDSLQKSRDHVALQRRAVSFATELAAERSLDRDTLDPCGRYNLAITPEGDTHIADYAAQLNRLSETHTMLDAAAVAGVTGSKPSAPASTCPAR